MMNLSCLRLALLILLLTSCVKAQDQDDDWEGWSCDDMTPDLCDDLKLTRVKVPTRANLSMAHFIYTPMVALNGKSPVVVVNGGPGLPHNCVIPLKALACKGRKVVFYDQVGTGKSSFPPNATAAEDFPFAADVNYKAHEELPLVLEDAGIKSIFTLLLTALEQ